MSLRLQLQHARRSLTGHADVKEACKTLSHLRPWRAAMQIRTIAGIILLGFAATLLLHWSTLAYWWSQRAPRSLSLAPLAAAGAHAPASFRRAGVLSANPPAGSGARRADAPAAVAPADAAYGRALPVMLAIRAGARSAESPGGARELDLVNTSDDPLTIAVLIADVPKGEFFVPPRVEQHLGIESGLELEPGSQVTLRSPGFEELTETVR